MIDNLLLQYESLQLFFKSCDTANQMLQNIYVKYLVEAEHLKIHKLPIGDLTKKFNYIVLKVESYDVYYKKLEYTIRWLYLMTRRRLSDIEKEGWPAQTQNKKPRTTESTKQHRE